MVLQANGFSTIAMTGNKPYFVGLIIRLWKGDITQDSGGQVLPVATVSSEPAKLVSNHPAPSLHSLPRSVQAIAVPKQTPAPVPASRALPKQSLPHVFNEMNSRIGAILSTQEKREVYNILCGYPGMKKEEILNILAVWPPASALNLDEVMLRIISKRQVTCDFVLNSFLTLFCEYRQYYNCAAFSRRKVSCLCNREWRMSNMIERLWKAKKNGIWRRFGALSHYDMDSRDPPACTLDSKTTKVGRLQGEVRASATRIG